MKGARTRRLRSGSVIAFYLCAIKVCAAQGATYQNSVHIDKNTGTLTINRPDQSTHNTNYYQTTIEAGVTEKTIQELLGAAQKKAGAEWKREFQKSLDRLNATLADRHSDLVTRLTAIQEKVTSLEAEVSRQPTRSEAEQKEADEARELLELLREQQQQVLDALLRDERERARVAAAHGERLAFDYDQRTEFGAVFMIQALLFNGESAVQDFTFALGLRLTYDFLHLDDNARRRLRLVVGLSHGWGSSTGGYAAPDGTLLERAQFSVSLWSLQGGISYASVIGQRGNVEIGPSLRLGVLEYRNDAIPTTSKGSLQVPLDLQFTYKPIAALALGLSVGAGYEFFAHRPILQYTGVGAENAPVDSRGRLFMEGGVHAAYRW